MSIERISANLADRFAAPVDDFYQRRIIVWYDSEREFEHHFAEIQIEDVKTLVLTETNSFAVKKQLLADDPTSNYLLYLPFSYQQHQDNWLLDIELMSESFLADQISMYIDELRIDSSTPYREVIKKNRKFFDNKERRTKLARLVREYHSPNQLQIDLFVILAGLSEGRLSDVIIEMLDAGLDRKTNPVLGDIEKFANADEFWRLVLLASGHQDQGEVNFSNLASRLLLTASSQSMPSSSLKGMEHLINQTAQTFCYNLVDEWAKGPKRDSLYRIARDIEQSLDLTKRFDEMNLEELLRGSLFPGLTEVLIRRSLQMVSQQQFSPDVIHGIVANRRVAHWNDYFNDFVDCLEWIANIRSFYLEHNGKLYQVDAKSYWRAYTKDLHLMDRYYRKFYSALDMAYQRSNPILEDDLKQAVSYVESVYQNWYLSETSQFWTDAIKDDLSKLGYISNIDRQRDFYYLYVEKSLPTRTFVIISDALRYEIAAELTENISLSTRGKSELRAVQGIFPTITKFGMAALLPGSDISYAENQTILVDGMSSQSSTDREKILIRKNPNSVIFSYSNLKKWTKQERRDKVAGKDVIYIYHNTIDAFGDKLTTESKVFSGASTAIEEIIHSLRIVVNDMNATNIIITADHGFMYTDKPLEERDKLDRSLFTGTVYEHGRRYSLVSTDTTADYLLPVSLESVNSGLKLKGYTPQGMIRMKVPGGGNNYVHGGISLQEICVPVIVFKSLRPGSRGYVEAKHAEIQLVSVGRKISNRIFSLDFFQTEPMGDKVQSATYQLYFIDELGDTVSDIQTIIADRESQENTERNFRVRFHLKARSYDRNRNYRLVFKRDNDLVSEENFQIDIAFSDDLGFEF